jgi:ketosteroid isomerase-like protein
VHSVRAWVAAWGDEVAAVDLATARHRFDEGVVAFGTHADIVRGLDELERQQWSQVWPAIEDFRFEVADLEVLVSPDRLMAVAVVPWSSTGIDVEGAPFDRPGRATIVLQREQVDAEWRGMHTHFSLARGVPQRTHGGRSESR